MDDILVLFGVKPSDRISAAKKPADIEIPLVFPTREQILSGNAETADEQKTTSKEDCFSCKVVGCSVLSGAAGAILYAVKTNTPNFTGRKLRWYRAQGASVASGKATFNEKGFTLSLSSHHLYCVIIISYQHTLQITTLLSIVLTKFCHLLQIFNLLYKPGKSDHGLAN